MADDDKLELETHLQPGRRRRVDTPAAQADGPPAQADRNPDWPAQYDTDGWDEVPAQMRP